MKQKLQLFSTTTLSVCTKTLQNPTKEQECTSSFCLWNRDSVIIQFITIQKATAGHFQEKEKKTQTLVLQNYILEGKSTI